MAERLIYTMQIKDGVGKDDFIYFLLVILFVHNIFSQSLSIISFAHTNPISTIA